MELHMEGVVPSSLTLTTWDDWGFESSTWKMLSFIFYWGTSCLIPIFVSHLLHPLMALNITHHEI